MEPEDKADGLGLDLVNHDHIDPTAAKLVEQPVEAGPLNVTAGEATIVITPFENLPALMALAEHEGLTGLSLCIE
jgi:hypothetical protein